MITVLWPMALVALPIVLLVAIWALLRPSRRMAVVGSLELWQKAQNSLDRSARRRSRRITLPWALLLVGAVAAVMAAAGPAIRGPQATRLIAVAPVCSAELAVGQGAKELSQAVGALLKGLGPDDQVQLLLPALLGGNTRPMSPSEAFSRVADLPMLPAPARDLLTLAPAMDDVQHVYYFAAAGAGPAPGPKVSVVELPTQLGALWIDACAAAPVAGGRVQVFVAIKSPAVQGQTPQATLRAMSIRLPSYARLLEQESLVPMPGGDGKAVLEFGEQPALAIEAEDASPNLPVQAFLVRRKAMVRKVAMIGPDQPLIRRYIQIDKTLQLVGSVDQADLVIATNVEPPAGKSALVIDPAADPPGWRRGAQVGPLALSGLDVAADDPVMRNVDLRDVAVRAMRPWVGSDQVSQKALASYRKDAVILRDQPEVRSDDSEAPRRIYVAFDTGQRNTNFAMSRSFVIFLSNAMSWLAGGAAPGQPSERYESVTPMQAGRQSDWKRICGQAPEGVGRGPLLWPGIYADRSGELHAVSLTGLKAGSPALPPAKAVASLVLPPPLPRSSDRPLWPGLTIAAGLLWLAGWTLRLK